MFHPKNPIFLYHLANLLLLIKTSLKIKPLPKTIENLVHYKSFAILVPCRNEEKRISTLIESLQKLDYPSFHVYVYNDESTDQTGQILSAYAKTWNRLSIIQGTQLPDGWTGKNWALHCLANQVREDYLVFLDADSEVTHTDFLTRISLGLETYEVIGGIPKFVGSGLFLISASYFFLFSILWIFKLSIYNQVWAVRRKTFLIHQPYEHFKNQPADDVTIGHYFTRMSKWNLCDFTDSVKVHYADSFHRAFSAMIRTSSPMFGKWLSPLLIALIFTLYLHPWIQLRADVILLLLVSKQVFDRKHRMSFWNSLTFPFGLVIFLFCFYLSWMTVWFNMNRWKSRPLPTLRT